MSLISGSYSLGPVGGGAAEFNAGMVEKDAIADARWYMGDCSELPWVTDGRRTVLEQLKEGLCRRTVDAARQMLREKGDMTCNWRVDNVKAISPRSLKKPLTSEVLGYLFRSKNPLLLSPCELGGE